MSNKPSISGADTRDRVWTAELLHRRMAVARWRGSDRAKGGAAAARSCRWVHQRRDIAVRTPRVGAAD